MGKWTPGPWIIETSNSWRRIGTGSGGGSVCCPIKQNDGHPDLYFRNGGADGPDARLISLAPEMAEALRECADRLERAAIAGGTDPEFAAIAVERYRALLAKLEENT